MSTKSDNRALLLQMIKKMDETEAKQMLAFAAGFEAGKLNQTVAGTSTKVQIQCELENYLK